MSPSKPVAGGTDDLPADQEKLAELELQIVEACEAARAGGFTITRGTYVDRACCCPMGAVALRCPVVDGDYIAAAAELLDKENVWVIAFAQTFDQAMRGLGTWSSHYMRRHPDAVELGRRLAERFRSTPVTP